MTDHAVDPPVEVTVVVCVLNGSRVIGDQLAALAGQRATVAWEVVVVDNGSTDDTVAVVRAAADRFPASLRVVDASARRGICHARNVGASAARGRFLAFCDCDDVVAPGWVQAAADGLRDADVLAGGLRELGTGFRADAPAIEGGSYVQTSFGGAVIGCNFAVRRDAYFSVGGFDESLPPYGCDDAEFSLRVNKAALTVTRSDDMVVHFRRTSGLRVLLRKTYVSAQAEALVWSRHSDRYGERLRPAALIGGVIGIGPAVLRGLANGTPRRTVARLAVTRLGNAVGYWRLVRGDRSGPLLVHEPVATRESEITSRTS